MPEVRVADLIGHRGWSEMSLRLVDALIAGTCDLAQRPSLGGRTADSRRGEEGGRPTHGAADGRVRFRFALSGGGWM
jgi:hypothetical protein